MKTLKHQSKSKTLKSSEKYSTNRMSKEDKDLKRFKDVKETRNNSISSYEDKRKLLRGYLMNKDQLIHQQQLLSKTSTTKLDANVAKMSASAEQLMNQLTSDDNSFIISERFIFLLCMLYSILAIVSLFFYKNKKALCLTGGVCSLHMFKYYILKFNRLFLRINSSLSNVIVNLIWLIGILTIIIHYILKDDKELDKIEFKDEIILHIGLSIYSPFVIYSSYVSFKMFLKKIEFLDLLIERNKEEVC